MVKLSLSLSHTHTHTGAPEIVIAPSNTEVLEGNTALFTCVAYGAIPPEIYWYNNYTGLIYNTSRVSYYTNIIEQDGIIFVQSILEICGAEPYDSGLYSCVAITPGVYNSSSSAYFYVDVLEPEGAVYKYMGI